MRSQVDLLCPPGLKVLGRRSVLQGSQRCFIPHSSRRCTAHGPPARIRLTVGGTCDPPIPCSFPPRSQCWFCSALPAPGDLQKQEHGEEGSWGTPASGSTFSSPQGRNTSIFQPVFLYLGSRYLDLCPHSGDGVIWVLENKALSCL